LRHAYGGRFDAVYVVGMVEGSFPPRGRDDPLLPDRERRAVPGIALRADRRGEDRRDYLAALATAPERVLCSSRADPRAQRTQRPARWLLETAEVRHGDALGADGLTTLELSGAPSPWLDTIASFEAGILHDHEPGSTTEHDLRELVAWRAGGRPIGQHPLTTAVLGAGVAALEARASSRLTAFDGFVGEVPLRTGANRPVSPTALQDWAACPFRYFLARVLRVREVPKPETIQTISALDEGTLVHAILEDFLGRARRRLGPDDEWDDVDWALMAEIVAQHCDDAARRGITGRPLSWQLAQRRIRRSAERFLRTDDEVRAVLEMIPSAVGVEVAFGDDDSPVGVDIGNGRRVAFRGRIDRLDRSEDGSRAVVYDYKTGRAHDIAEDPVDAGRSLQLPVYAAAARAHTGIGEISTYYWYTTEEGRDAALAGFELDEALEARFATVVGSIVDGIEHGCFVAVPGAREWDFRGRRETHANCLFCPYDRICPPDRSTAWERKGDDDAIAPFLALELPDDDGDGGDGSS
jgi:RecB family exonuclease